MGVVLLWVIGKIAGPATSDQLLDTNSTSSITADPYETYDPSREARIQNLIAQKYANQEEIATFDFDEKSWWQYDIADINISTDSSTSTLGKYGVDLSVAFSPYTLLKRDPVAVVQEIYATGATSSVAEITDTATLHKTALKELLVLSVPAVVVDLHLKIINNIELQTVLLANMAEIADQPVLALQSSQIYQLINLEFYKNLSDLNKFFDTNNIIIPAENKITIPVTIGQ